MVRDCSCVAKGIYTLEKRPLGGHVPLWSIVVFTNFSANVVIGIHIAKNSIAPSLAEDLNGGENDSVYS